MFRCTSVIFKQLPYPSNVPLITLPMHCLTLSCSWAAFHGDTASSNSLTRILHPAEAV